MFKQIALTHEVFNLVQHSTPCKANSQSNLQNNTWSASHCAGQIALALYPEMGAGAHGLDGSMINVGHTSLFQSTRIT